MTQSREMFIPPTFKNSSSIFCGNEIVGVFTVKIYFIMHTNTAEFKSVLANALVEAFLWACVFCNVVFASLKPKPFCGQ